jgi:hypothetical protein
MTEQATAALGDSTAKQDALSQTFNEVYGTPLRFVKPGEE